MRRADQRNMSNWVQCPQRAADEVVPQLPLQPQSVGRLELRRRPAEPRRQRQRARRCSPTTGAPGWALNLQSAVVRRPRDARRPGRVSQRATQHVGVCRGRSAQAGLDEHLRLRRRRTVGQLDPGTSARRRTGGRRRSLRLSTGLCRSARITISRNGSSTLDDRYVFGEHRSAHGRRSGRALNYTVTPDADDSALRASRSSRPATTATFKQLVDGRSRDYDGRYAPVDYSDNPDFNYRSFRTTNVVRWEYRPGSTLFVVWQQGREDELDTRHVRLQAGLRRRVRARRRGTSSW